MQSRHTVAQFAPLTGENPMFQAMIRGAVLIVLLVATAQAGGTQSPAPAAAGKLAPVVQTHAVHKARVAQNGQVELAASQFSDAQLAGMRPDYAQLKPRARTNAE
jgi:hypothetical protein